MVFAVVKKNGGGFYVMFEHELFYHCVIVLCEIIGLLLLSLFFSSVCSCF